MTICSLQNDNLLSCCVYSDIPENSDCTECVTFLLPHIKFNLSSGVFERWTTTGSKSSSLFVMEEFFPGKFDEKIVFIMVFVVSQLVECSWV